MTKIFNGKGVIARFLRVEIFKCTDVYKQAPLVDLFIYVTSINIAKEVKTRDR